jgi:hypothetical protein
MTAPRLPFEKSYSALIILYLSSRGATRGDQAKFALSHGVDDHQNAAGVPQADPDEPFLRLEIWVRTVDRKGIGKDSFRVRERNAVLALILSRLCRIELKPHSPMVYTSYASVNGTAAETAN